MRKRFNSFLRPLLILTFACFNIEAYSHVNEPDTVLFHILNELPWQEKFHDTGTENWQDYWTLDGMKAAIENTSEGMEFSAGPVFLEGSSHSVIWTNESFKGDVKIEFIHEGHIGIRHMATRSGRYKNFRVSILDSAELAAVNDVER